MSVSQDEHVFVMDTHKCASMENVCVDIIQMATIVSNVCRSTTSSLGKQGLSHQQMNVCNVSAMDMQLHVCMMNKSVMDDV
jgi:hypothetical protein